MGYSRSIRTLEKVLGDLADLAMGKPQAWIIQGDPKAVQDWAYKVREALFVAALYPQAYPSLANAAKDYTIEVHGNRVEARRARQTTEFAAAAGEGINTGQEIARRSVQTSGKQTVFLIVDSWRKAQPTNDPMHFPQAALSQEELGLLYKWAQAWKPPLMLMVDGEAVTIGPADKHVIKYAWRPIEEELPVERKLESPRVKREGGEP